MLMAIYKFAKHVPHAMSMAIDDHFICFLGITEIYFKLLIRIAWLIFNLDYFNFSHNTRFRDRKSLTYLISSV